MVVHIYLDHNNKSKFKSIKNKKFINSELKKYNYLFSNINGYSLDKEQRIAVVTDEVNTLVIAGAGSGKSLTIVGKIQYLLQKGISTDEILCITFTKEAARSLEEKLNSKVKVYTFHSLAYSLLKKNNYSVVQDNYLEYIIDEYFYFISNNDSMIYKVKCLLNKIDTPYKYIINSNELLLLKRLILTFINLFKTNNYTLNDFLQINENKYLISIIIDIYYLYNEELKSTNSIDYNDMIVLATQEIKNTNMKYKYIIVDEYQDTSYIRYELLKQIINKTNAKLICVGDDYQSIYRFNGCDIDMFINFKKYFRYTKIVKISNTYRNSQELINVAGSFIMKNSNQLYKKLKSNKHINKPIIICYFNDIYKLLDKLIDKYKSILILGRNNNDINIFKTKEFIYKNCSIKCMTIHSSKGLEDECVILLNAIDSSIGIPNKIQNPKILNYVINNKLKFPYDEERRLFYVALTRTKNEIYIMTRKNNESIFIKELKKDYKNYIMYI